MGSRMDLPFDSLKPFKSLTIGTIKIIFGSGGTFKRGQKFAKEGFVHAVTISLSEADDDAVVSAFCWASQTKDKNHKVFLAINCIDIGFLGLDFGTGTIEGNTTPSPVPYHQTQLATYMYSCPQYSNRAFKRKIIT